MTVSSRKKGRALGIAAAAIAALLSVPFGVAGAVSASPSNVTRLVTLGDSIAAGQGGGTVLDACARTDGGYGSQLDAEPQFNLLRNAACTGAGIADVYTQLGQINNGTNLDTITVGANDVGIDAVYAACAAAVADPSYIAVCNSALAAAAAAVPGLVAPLTELIGDTAERAPRATIVVTGYPHLLEPVPLPLQPLYPELTALVDAVNSTTDALNLAILTAVTAAAGSGIDVRYTDVTAAFAGHGVQLVPGVPSDPWFGLEPGTPGYLHPTFDGYSAYRDSILATLAAP